MNRPSWISEDDRITASCNALRQKLEQINDQEYAVIQGHLDSAVDNFIANARWRFVNPGGPRIARVSEKDPLMYK